MASELITIWSDELDAKNKLISELQDEVQYLQNELRKAHHIPDSRSEFVENSLYRPKNFFPHMVDE